MPSFPVNRRFCTAATCWISRITNSEEGVVQCAPMVNVPHSPLHRSDRVLNPGPSHGSPLRYRYATQAPLTPGEQITIRWSKSKYENTM